MLNSYAFYPFQVYVLRFTLCAFTHCLSNKYVDPHYCRAEMYVGCVACCPLVSHSEYTDVTDRQTDGRQTVKLRFPLDVASVIIAYTTAAASLPPTATNHETL